MTENIYATAICIEGKAILLIGESGSGKSDLALRLIMNKNAVLIADDRVDVNNMNGVLKASCPQNIQGLLEVRGVGICKMPFAAEADVKMAVRLVAAETEIERIPEKETIVICGIKVPVINVHPFEISATDKIIIACGNI